MTYCPIPSEWCVEIKYFKKNLFYLKSTARATQNRLVCHLGHACHRFASTGVMYVRLSDAKKATYLHCVSIKIKPNCLCHIYLMPDRIILKLSRYLEK